MKRAIFTVLGLLLCGAAVVLFCNAIYEIGRIGTCASGGPYVSARPCPAGTGLTIGSIFIAVFAGLAGLGLYSAGGLADRGRSARVGLPILMWSFTFLGAAGAMAFAAFGQAANPDGGNGAGAAGVVLLIVFIPMGLVPLITSLRSVRDDPPEPRATGIVATTAWPSPPRPTVLRPTPAPANTGDLVERLEKLDHLRTSGAITQAEFDRLKAKLLAES